MRRLMFYLSVLCLLTAACQAAPPIQPMTFPTSTLVPPTITPVPPTATTISPTPTTSIPVLELVSPDKSITLTMAELMELPTSEGYAGIKSSTGRITPPQVYKGVSLKDLVNAYSGIDETMGLNIVAEDGYAITFSYDQIMNSTFIAYDPATGDELKSSVALNAILAYTREDQPLDPKEDGTLRLVIISPENNQVTDGHWSVKWVNGVEIKALIQDWNLTLDGAIEETIDRASFESCVNCHKSTWKDDKAQEWTGIPLWLLLGFVDDEIKHEGPAFNDSLAQTGYLSDVIAADGYTISLDSARVARNNDMIVAHSVNENPLPDQYFPLRLVGSAVEKNEQIGQITKLMLNLKDIPLPTQEEITATETTTPPPSVEGDLIIYGKVAVPLGLNEADMRSMEVVEISTEHPKKGQQTYQGLRLNDLLEQIKPDQDATSLVFTAKDGYTAEMILAEAQNCVDCLIAFTESPGQFNLAMPGLSSDLWVKGLVMIEVR